MNIYTKILFNGLKLVLLAGLLVSAACVGLSLQKGYKLMTVESGSMSPSLRIGDLVIVQPLVGWPRVGDLVSFTSSKIQGEIVTHRVFAVDKNRDIIVTKGDNLNAVDPPIRRRQIVGKVSWHSFFAGLIIEKLRSPKGLIVGIYLPGLVAISLEIKHLIKKLAKYRHYSLAVSGR